MFKLSHLCTFRASRAVETICRRSQHNLPRARICSTTSPQRRKLFTKQGGEKSEVIMASTSRTTTIGIISVVIGGSVLYLLYENNLLQPLPPTKPQSQLRDERQAARAVRVKEEKAAAQNAKNLSALPFQEDPETHAGSGDESAWTSFTNKIQDLSSLTGSFKDIKWTSIPGSISDYVVPEWAKVIPDNVSKLQRELSMAPGSLADEIWQEAHDPHLNPEIETAATVRVSDDLCDDEKDFLVRRRAITRVALAKYLGLPEEEIHPEDIPCIAMVGSGGGLRALVAGTGSFLAAHEAGLSDCATYTAGVSGSCWFQALYHSSLGGRRLDKLLEHLKARLGTHIAAPIPALAELNTAPTNKFLLKGFVEKLKGDPKAEFGLVDVYGVLLAARLLVPKGELGVDDSDLKLSNQRENIRHGEHPLPIYCAIRHEIPIIEESSREEKITQKPSEATKVKAKKESWFQWFEITPYEMFCEEFNAGIPTWAIGRKFNKGRDVHKEGDYRVPEVRLPLLLGIFGSAFCATLSLYYKEVRPMLSTLAGFSSIDEMVEGRDDDMEKVHPILPASVPNPFLGMGGTLPETTPESICEDEHLQLMDAGMDNNLPIYPLLRPGRAIDVIIAFDASADIKTENWLSVADGYAKQRGIKGWPIGAGWPKESDSAEKTAKQLDNAQAATAAEADEKVEEAKVEQKKHLKELSQHDDRESKAQQERRKEDPGDLGCCTVWVGTTEEREHTDDSNAPPSKAVEEDWQLMEPNAGITVIYFPFLSNPKVENVDPVTAPYMSTWNFIYTPEDIDNVVKLAKANFEDGREKTRRTIRAVYERKKKLREEREGAEKKDRFRRMIGLQSVGKKVDVVK